VNSVAEATVGRPRFLGTGLTRNHVAQIDGLRGIAILLVVVYHYAMSHRSFDDRHPALLLQMSQVGWMGVDLFFVLSGFLITGILLETKNQPHYFRNFLVRRFLRIWPLYYLTLLLFMVVLPLVLGKVPDELRGMHDNQIWFWLYGANWLFASQGGFEGTSGGYFWSLAVEEQFYLVWPLVVYWLSPRRLGQVCVGMLVMSLVLRLAALAYGMSGSAVYVMTFTHLDSLAVGTAIAVAIRSPGIGERLARYAIPTIVVAVVAISIARFQDGDFLYGSRGMAAWGLSAVALFFGGCVLLTLRTQTPGNAVASVLSSGFLVATGRYSYALYLVHVPVLRVVEKVTLGPGQAVTGGWPYDLLVAGYCLVAFALAWLLSAASWLLFEQHVLKLKKYVAYRQPSEQP
jgi:peptidoglycan/LPS O-acetylase OafA/YrhL